MNINQRMSRRQSVRKIDMVAGDGKWRGGANMGAYRRERRDGWQWIAVNMYGKNARAMRVSLLSSLARASQRIARAAHGAVGIKRSAPQRITENKITKEYSIIRVRACTHCLLFYPLFLFSACQQTFNMPTPVPMTRIPITLPSPSSIRAAICPLDHWKHYNDHSSSGEGGGMA